MKIVDYTDINKQKSVPTYHAEVIYVFKEGSVNIDMVDSKQSPKPKTDGELADKLEQDYNKYLKITKQIVGLFHDAEFTNFEAFIVLEGVKQNLSTDIINFSIQRALAGEKMLQDIFQEGKVGAKFDGPYQ